MMKAKEYDIENSNIALLGSDLEREVKKAAAETEAAWTDAGKTAGIQVWRIEKFSIAHWPKDEYGHFFSGDSYIVLHTYKPKPDSDALAWDVYFWLGRHTTQDEAGTAAYKTVELDTLLDDAPIQHREVQGHESDAFVKLFMPPGLRIMEGGIESGFNHVEPTEYRKRLLQIKGKKGNVRVMEVPLSHESLNAGDIFVLDEGLKAYQFNGSSAGAMEKSKASQFVRALDDERGSKVEIVVCEQGESGEDIAAFWEALGGEGPIKTAEEGGPDDDLSIPETRLLRLSDESGSLTFNEVAKGKTISADQLDSSDVFVLDSGPEVFAWIGKGASDQERKQAMYYAQKYLTSANRPAFVPITRILEGGENELFQSAITA